MKFGNESKDALRIILVLFNAILFTGGFDGRLYCNRYFIFLSFS